MIAGVADTHAALWYLLRNPLLSAKARQFMDKRGGVWIGYRYSPVSLAEIVYLIEKNRLPSANVYTDLRAVLEDPDHMFKEAHSRSRSFDAMRQVPRADVADMPDRIVAATAASLSVPVISRDGKIRASNVQPIW